MMNQKTPHIEFEQINDFVLDEIETAEKAEIAAHLAACPMCAMQQKRIEQTLNIMRTDKIEDVPNYLSERVFDMFEPNPLPIQTEKTSVFDKISAMLESDKFAPAFGLRSNQWESVRQLKYVADGIEIALQVIFSSDNEWRINGQVSGNNIPEKVELSDESTRVEAEINDFAEFSFTSVKAGKYNLYVTIDNYEIELKEILIGHKE